MQNEYDSMIVGRIKGGDRQAFDMLFDIYQKRVYNIALGLCKNEHDAMDVAQEAFLRIYKSIKTFREDSSLSTWIYRITVNAAYDFLRAQSKRSEVPIEMAQNVKAAATPEAVYEKLEKRQAVRAAIEKLNEEHKAVIILRDINGLSYSEIAQALSIEEGTVKSRLFRARAMLRKILDGTLE